MVSGAGYRLVIRFIFDFTSRGRGGMIMAYTAASSVHLISVCQPLPEYLPSSSRRHKTTACDRPPALTSLHYEIAILATEGGRVCARQSFVDDNYKFVLLSSMVDETIIYGRRSSFLCDIWHPPANNFGDLKEMLWFLLFKNMAPSTLFGLGSCLRTNIYV